MDNYKGLYYKESKEQKFYEGGAHFSYEKLYQALYYLKEEQDKKELLMKQQKNISSNQNNKNIFSPSGQNTDTYINDIFQNNNNNNNNNRNKNKPRTRNVVNNCFYNHPNTKIKNVLNKSNNNNNNNNQHLSIGLSYSKKKPIGNSRNYTNDFNLFYNRTSNHINNDISIFQDTDLSGINNKNNLSNYVHKKVLNKNNSTNQIKNKKLNENNYLYNNLKPNIKTKAYQINDKNKRNDSYILNNTKRLNLLKSNNIEIKKNINNNNNNNKKTRKINSSSKKINNINNININNFINNGESNKKQRNNSGMNAQMNHSINNYINVNINNNNNINVNINNVSYQNNKNNNDINFKNKQASLNQVLISLIKSNNKKYLHKKEKSKEKEHDSIFNYLNNNKSRNTNEKSGLCHVKSMDYNNKPLNTDFVWNDSNTFYDKTFNNNNNRLNNNLKMNNNYQVNISTQGNKLNWNYSHLKMKDNNKKKNISFNPIKNSKGIIYKDIINKLNFKNINNSKQKKKNETKTIVKRTNPKPINLGKYNIINNKYTNNEILSKYIGYFKKNNKK